MTWTTRLLAIINTIVAGILFWYVGNSAYKRADFTNGLDQLRRTRDGLSTAGLFQKVWEQLSPDDRERLVEAMNFDENPSAPNPEATTALLSRLSEADQRQLRALQDRKKAEQANRQAAYLNSKKNQQLPLRVPFRADSEAAKRDVMAHLLYNPVNRLGLIVAGPALVPFEVNEGQLYEIDDKGQYVPKKNNWYQVENGRVVFGDIKVVRPDGRAIEPDKIGDPSRLLLVGKEESKPIKEMAHLVGFENFKRLYRETVLLHQARLGAEEVELADRKATLLALQARFQHDLVRFKEEADLLRARLESEKTLRLNVARENDERRSELARIYAEMAEAYSAREGANGRARDAQRMEQDAKSDINQLLDENRKLLEAINKLLTNEKK